MTIRTVLLLACTCFFNQVGAFNVTFRLQMTGVNGFNTPELNGTFNNWCGACNPLSDSDGNGVWETTIQLPAGYFEYKFSADNWSQQETLPVGASCTATTGQFTNRTINVNANTVLPIVCWGSCTSCTNYQVTFRVNMASVSGFTTPYVSGNFNGWCGNCLPMNDQDGDQIWTATTTLTPGLYEYKYSYDNWVGAENLLPGSPCTMTTGSFTNRFINLTQSQTLPVVCWGSCDSPGASSGPQPNIQIALTSGTNPSCEGTELVFTATASNVLSAPSYQWQVNGANVGTNSATLTSIALQNGDQVSCRLSGGAGCSTNMPVVSNIIQVMRVAPVTPSVAITASVANPLCQGSAVTFTAQPTNGGLNPNYQWKLNGQNVGTNSSTYTTSNLTNGQIVTCQLTSSATCVTSPWNLIWSDEFNGTSLDATKWTPELGASGWGNNEWQNYTSSVNNIQFSNGQLHIVARNDGPAGLQYSSARLITKNNFSFKYGRVTGRLQLPLGQGIWPAFWMLGANIDQVPWPGSGEIDIMEHINNETRIYGTSHWNNGGLNSNSGSIVTPVTGFHDYTVEWDSLSIRFIMDGVQYHQHFVNASNGSFDEFTKPFFLLLNVAIGGNWPGYPDASTVFPVQMDVDYVRVWQQNTSAGSPTALSNSITVSVQQPQVWYRDNDGDGYGNASVTTTACSAPTGYVSNSTDCNDNSSSINPAAVEICSNSIDDNCNNLINENCCSLVLSAIVSNTSCTAAASGSIDLSVSGGTTYSYSWSNGASTQDILNLANGTYTVTVTSGSCSQTGTYTVGNSNSTGPAAPTSISGPAGVCRNSTGQVFTTPAISGATSYTWTLPNGATGTSTTNTITLSFSSTYSTGNLCVRAVNVCGQSASFCRSVTAYTSNPAAPGTISGPSTSVCAGTTQTYSISAVTNATSYTWTAPTNATITSGQGTTSVTVSYSSAFTSGALSVRSVNCFGQSSNRTLNIYSIPSTPSALTGTFNNVCPGSVLTYSIAAVQGASSYTWTAPTNTTITSGQGTNSISLSIGSSFTSGTLSVRAISGCGQSGAQSATLNKNPPTPSAMVGQTSNLCGGGQFTYSVSPVNGATTYAWTIPSGCSIITNSGNSIVLNIPSTFTTGTLSVRAYNSCGGSSLRSASLTRLPATPVSISGPASVCPNQVGVNFTTPAVTGVTQLWTAPTGAVITAGSNTTSMTCTWGTTSGNVSVRNVNSCGQSAARTKTVSLTTCMTMPEDSSELLEVMEEEVSISTQLEIFPNPSNGTFVVRSSEAGVYRIMSSTGQLIDEIQLNESNNYSFVVSGLSTGLYFVRGYVRSDYLIQRVVVTN